MNVKILLTVTNPALYENSTMVLDTIRVGFPTANITVFDNHNAPNVRDKLKSRAKIADANFIEVAKKYHHAEWIKRCVVHGQGQLVLVDGDVVFWSNCEDYSFNTHLAGYHVPVIYNEFAKCVSFERLHTSFLWVKDCEALVDATQQLYPPAVDVAGEYCPFDPYMPCVQFVRGKPMFWDSTAALYNMVGGTGFGPDMLEKYDHINSASFYDVMLSRVDDPVAFAKQHELAKKNPLAMRGFHKAVGEYYKRMNEKAIAMESSQPSRN